MGQSHGLGSKHHKDPLGQGLSGNVMMFSPTGCGSEHLPQRSLVQRADTEV